MQFIPFQDTDEFYTALVDLRNPLEPEDKLTFELIRKEDQELKTENHLNRFFGEMDNQFISSGSYWHSLTLSDGPYQFSVKVHPDYQNGHIPGQMQDFLLSQIEEADPALIVSEAKEDEIYLTKLLEDANFNLKMRFPRSQLDCLVFNAAKYDSLNELLDRQGLEFVTLTEVMGRDPDWQ